MRERDVDVKDRLPKDGEQLRSSTGRAASLRQWAAHSVCVLAVTCVMLHAQTSNPPAQPPDWENPSGRYAVVMEEDAGLPDHTVYRPADLTAIQGEQRLPIVAFAGPGCDANGTAFRPFFTEVASHGFLLIVSGPPEPRGGSGPNFPKTAPGDLSASIDWAIAENSRPGSKYSGRIDTSKVAVMGQSCGGAQSLFISEDLRIDTIVMWNSTSFTSGPSGRGRGAGRGAPPAGDGPVAEAPTPAGVPAGAGAPTAAAAPGGRRGRGGRGGIPVPSVNPALLQTLRIPIAYFIGGERDILYGGAVADIALYEAAPLFWASIDIPGNDPHAGTFREKNGGTFGVVGVAWLEWRLTGDSQAARMFEGPDCGLCTDPRWDVRKKNME